MNERVANDTAYIECNIDGMATLRLQALDEEGCGLTLDKVAVKSGIMLCTVIQNQE